MSQSNGRNGKRQQCTTEGQATLLRRHLADKILGLDLCDAYHIQLALLYLSQRQALEQLSAALQDGRTRRDQGDVTPGS